MYNELVVPIKQALGAAAITAAVACVGTPTQTYPGPPLPQADVALLKETPETAVLTIDGVETYGSSWSLMPGSHEVLVRFRIFSTAPNVNWTIWSYCRVVLAAVAGEEYVALVRVRKEVAPGLSDKVTMEIGIADDESILRGRARSCLPKRPKQ